MPNKQKTVISFMGNANPKWYAPRLSIYLDDERETPPGWTRCYWPNEVIEWLKTGKVWNLSLDHDLGDDSKGTGYDVLLWIEEQVVTTDFVPPEIIIHTANPAARKRMLAAVRHIYELHSQSNKE